ncbi:PKD domain-containing protein [Halorubellus litoreus]|uniref:PKD domain-containing protein n=1 Tax=Halorubellus litoreus TaxID=755308 RepID=A0ABD5VM08_9EURY
MRRSDVGDERRAQSETIGFVLLFGVLITAAVGWQVGVVPQQNERVEFNHVQEVQSQMQELGATVGSMGSGSGTKQVGVSFGNRFPDRTLFVNPPPTGGRLVTVGSGADGFAANVTNATAVDEEENDYWTGANKSFGTAAFVYDPMLQAYDGGPERVVYENSLVYSTYGDFWRQHADQGIVNGRDVSLVTVNGSYSEGSSGEVEPTDVRLYPASASPTTVRVRNDSGGPIQIRVPTNLDQATWEDRLASEYDPSDSNPNRYVRAVEVKDKDIGAENWDLLVVTLEGNETYDLQLSKVRVGSAPERDEPPAYVTAVDGRTATVREGSDHRVTFEVRDRYDNPVSNATVNVTLVGPGELTADGASKRTFTNLRTDPDGEVTVTYGVDDVTGDQPVEVRVNRSGDPAGSFDRDRASNALVAFTVVDADADDGGTGGGGGGGGGGSYTVTWNDSGPITVDKSSASVLQLNATTGDLGNVPVEFSVSDGSVLSVKNATPRSNAAGVASVNFTLGATGTVYAYVTGGGTGDRVTVNVVSNLVPNLVWQDAGDFDAATSESGVVHAAYGDRRDSVVLLGNGPGDAGLVGYWPLDEDRGPTAADASGTGNDGSVQGDPAMGQSGIHGSSSYGLDGSNDWVRVPDDSSLELSRTDEATVSAWVRKDSAQSGWIAIAQHSDQSYNLQFTNGDVPAFTIYDGGWQTAQADSSLQTGRWYHVVGTFDGSTVRLYVDGVLVDTTSASYIADAGGTDLGLGENVEQSGRHLDGDLDEVRIYERAISTADVRALYNGTAPTASGTFEGSLVTDARTFNSPQDPTTLKLENASADVPPGTTVTVSVESDPDGDGTFEESSDPITITDGVANYPLPGTGDLSTQSDTYRVRVELSSDDPTVTPCFSGTALSADDSSRTTVGASDCPAENDPPSPSFTVTPDTAKTGETVTFDASASTDDTGSITSYVWDFDGDGPDGSDPTGEVLDETFGDDGTYDVTLYVTDDLGARSSTSGSVTVRNRPPTVSATLNRTTVRTFDAVELDLSATTDPDGDLVNYTVFWQGGNQNYEEQANTSKTQTNRYADDGTYTVYVNASDEDGNWTNVSVGTVTVQNRPPNADFYVQDGLPSPGEQVRFEDRSRDRDGSIDTIEYQFGDGNTSTTAVPTNQFAAGVYNVTLVVTDDDGATDTEAVRVQSLSPLVLNEYVLGKTQAVLESDFEGGNPAREWSVTTQDGDTQAYIATETANSGSQSVGLEGDEGLHFAVSWVNITSDPVDLTGSESATVSYWVRRGGFADSTRYPGENEDLVVAYETTSGAWKQLEVYDGSGTPGETFLETVPVPTDADRGSFRLRFAYRDANSSFFDPPEGGNWYVDDVAITKTPYMEAVSTQSLVDPSEYRVDVTRDGSTTAVSVGTDGLLAAREVVGLGDPSTGPKGDTLVEVVHQPSGRVVDCLAVGSTYSTQCAFNLPSSGGDDTYYRNVANDTDAAAEWSRTTGPTANALNPGQTTAFRSTVDWTRKIDEGFESGSLPAGWSGDASTFVTDDTARSGTYALVHNESAGSVESPTVNTSTANAVVVEYWVRRGGLFGNSEMPDETQEDDLVVEYYATDGTWTVLERYEGGPPRGEQFGEVLTLPADAVHDEFALRFRQVNGGGETFDYWHVDDVVVRTLGENESVPSPRVVPASTVAATEPVAGASTTAPDGTTVRLDASRAAPRQLVARTSTIVERFIDTPK